MICFKANQEKALEAIVYVASKVPGIDVYHTVKTMFYADKKHLNTYARPILGDLYIKMDNGPVPSLVKDIIDNNRFLQEELRANIKKAIETKGRNKNITIKRKPNLSYFSESDLECLDEAIDFCKDKSFDELKELTHTEEAWIKACMNSNMDYKLLIDRENPYHDDLIADLEENSYSMVL